MKPLDRQTKRDILAATELFAGLTSDDLDALAGLASERKVRRDEHVMRKGDPGSSLMVLVHGRVRAGAVSSEGKEVTHAMIEPGRVIGEIALLDGRPRSLDITAMVESLLLVIDRDAFLPFLTVRPALMLGVMGVLCARLRRVSATLEDVAMSPLQTRLARLLLELAESHGRATPDGTRIRLKMSQKDMSAQVAATREGVNRQLRAWHEQGVLGEVEGDILVRRPEELRGLVA